MKELSHEASVAQNGARAWTPRQEAGALELAVTTWGYWLLILGLGLALLAGAWWLWGRL